MIGILGAGISGLALAANLTKEYEILEMGSSPGGLCSSIIEDGYTFDAAGPHILFSKNQKVLDYMVGLLGSNVEKKARNNKIYIPQPGGYRLINYPFENDLASLSKQDNFECLRDFLNVDNMYVGTPENLEQWAYSTFGKSISNKYLLPYNRKIWKTEPSLLGLELVSRIPKPPVTDVIKSSLGIETTGFQEQFLLSQGWRLSGNGSGFL
jgi:protoporphyrinogen oxidase